MCASPPLVENEFSRGSLIARKYLVLGYLGRGAAGTVYLCQDAQGSGELRAVKLLTCLEGDPNFYLRFYREGKMAQRIRSPYVVRCYDLIADDGVFLYTMEYVRGGNLEELLGVTPLPALPLVYSALWQICQGLIEIHNEGIIHRDLKPSNILITDDVRFKITDLGIMKASRETELLVESDCRPGRLENLVRKHELERPTTAETKAGGLVGTVDYLSPEYVQYRRIDHRSDLYSLGTLAFRMLVGHVPFNSDTMCRCLLDRVECEAPEVSSIRPDIPVEISNLIASALERNPDSRPQSAREFCDHLECFLQDQEWFSYYLSSFRNREVIGER